MQSLKTLAAWVVSHPSESLTYFLSIGAAISTVVGMLPKSAQRWPVLGWVVRFFHRLSVLTHRDESGTFKWPFIARAVIQAATEASETPTPTPPPAPSSAPSGEGEQSVPPNGAGMVLLALGTLLCASNEGCPKLPPPDGCTPRDTRCSPAGEPEVCSATQRWATATRPCTEVGSVCCETASPYGRKVHACVQANACVSSDGGSQ